MLGIAVEDDEGTWDLKLPLFLFAYRTNMHKTSVSPFELIYGYSPRLPETAIPSHDALPSDNHSDLLKAWLGKVYQRVSEHAKKQHNHKKGMHGKKACGLLYHVNDMLLLQFPAVCHGWCVSFTNCGKVH